MPAHERHRAVSRRQAHHVVDPPPAAPVGTRESRWEEEIVALVGAIHPQADFYVVVRGDSMSSVGYRTGDIIAIKRTPDAAEGDVVMVRIGTEITLKCFHRPADDGVELKPCSSNPEHQPIVIDERTEDWENRRRGRGRDDRTAATEPSGTMSPAPNGLCDRDSHGTGGTTPFKP